MHIGICNLEFHCAKLVVTALTFIVRRGHKSGCHRFGLNSCERDASNCVCTCIPAVAPTKLLARNTGTAVDLACLADSEDFEGAGESGEGSTGLERSLFRSAVEQ